MALLKEGDSLTKLDADGKFRYIEKFMQAVRRLLNGNLEFDKNMLIQPQIVTFPASGVEVQISHGLKRVPRGYLVVSRDFANIVYDSATPWNESFIYLKGNGGFKAGLVFL